MELSVPKGRVTLVARYGRLEVRDVFDGKVVRVDKSGEVVLQGEVHATDGRLPLGDTVATSGLRSPLSIGSVAPRPDGRPDPCLVTGS